MGIFAISVRTTASLSTSAAIEIIAGTNTAYRVLELGFTIPAATAAVFGYGKPAAAGVTPATESTVQGEDSGNTTVGNTVVALSWGTSPTAPANYLRRVSLTASIGAGTILTFPRGRTVLKTVTDVLFNIVTGPFADVWVVVDE